MNHYLVTLDFSVNYAECNKASLPSPITPEAIVEQAEYVILEKTSEAGETRRYTVMQSISSETDDGLTGQLENLFCLLPGYVKVSVNAEDQGPTDDAGMGVEPATTAFRVMCLFRSRLPFDDMLALFKQHVADGNLVSNGMKPLEYVAFVNLSAISDDGLVEAVEALLSRAFGADSPDTAINFDQIMTKLI